MSNLIRKTRKVITEEEGFTLVELLIVMVISLIMLAGMVGLLAMGFQTFTDGRNLQALTDASRRALPAMDRQIKSLLHINDDECVASYKVGTTPAGVWNGISFYSDIDNDNGYVSPSDTGANVVNYTNAEKIRIYYDADKHALMQKTTQPGSTEEPLIGTTICSYVESLRIYYFLPGIAPGDGTPPDNRYQGDTLNGGAGSIKIVITMKNGKLTRTFEQTTFLRILERSPTGV